jgi:CRP/FNR family transcriptional regulator, cyclic AMP receptor protein
MRCQDTEKHIDNHQLSTSASTSHDHETAAEVIDSNLLLLFGAVFKTYSKDEYIFREGQEPHFYHQVVEGKIKLQNETDDEKVFIQGFFFPGQSFGEPPMFYGGEYPVSAIADQPSVVIRLNITSFMQLIKENFEAHLKITKVLSERLNRKQTILKEICCHTPEHRVLTLLMMLKKQILNGESDKEKLRIDYTRQQIACMTGLRVETVIRLMKSLNERNIISIEKGKVYF